MKNLFLRLLSRISRFLIESNFKSCKEISLNFFVKTQHFSKETGRPVGKNSSISNAISSAGPARARLDFFPVKVHDQGFQK
jgi:hypothetical protein